MKFWSLQKLISYEDARELQHFLVDLRARDLIEDTVLFLEHHPVITRGRGLQFNGTERKRHMPFLQPLPPGVSFSESERGGDLTYHGPGQLVVYPICKLDGKGFGPLHDVTAFLRKLEAVFIESLLDPASVTSLAHLRDIQIGSRQNATGVWLGEKKLISIGIAVRKWVTYHGVAINCVNDLSPFHLISPCGFSPEVMTRLADWVQLGQDWREWLELEWVRRMCPEAQLQSLSLEDAWQLGRAKAPFNG